MNHHRLSEDYYRDDWKRQAIEEQRDLKRRCGPAREPLSRAERDELQRLDLARERTGHTPHEL